MKVNLTDKVALVTGAGRNIGKAIADSLADNGAVVYYSDTDMAAVTAATEGHRNARPILLDVTQAESIETAVRSIIESCGHLDILCNNAGVNTAPRHRVTIDQFSREEWDRILNVDLTGLYEVSRIVATQMCRQNSGRIINIGSVVGLVPMRLQCAFAAAKAGVLNLTKAMALELAPFGILVNAIAPGSILTEGTRKLFYGSDGTFSANAERMLSHIPLGRPGDPTEIAIAALYLSDPENSYMTGHVLTVDGGWTAGFARDF